MEKEKLRNNHPNNGAAARAYFMHISFYGRLLGPVLGRE